LYLLLNNQYISIGGMPDFLLKCILGSGMGLLFPGHVSNISFFQRVERHILSHGALSSMGISSYFRFFDDIWFLAEDLPAAQALTARMKSSAAHFSIKCSGVTQTRIRYLDVDTVIQSGVLIVRPTAPKELIPLASSSGHVQHVHQSWPQAALRNKINLASGDLSYAIQLIRHYANANASGHTVHIMSRYLSNLVKENLKPGPIVQSSPPGGNQHDKFPTSDDRVTNCMWLRIDFHPIWHQTIGHAIKRVGVPSHLSCLCIRIAWLNGFRNLMQVVKLCNHHHIDTEMCWGGG